jgi:hypothetical protein
VRRRPPHDRHGRRDAARRHRRPRHRAHGLLRRRAAHGGAAHDPRRLRQRLPAHRLRPRPHRRRGHVRDRPRPGAVPDTGAHPDRTPTPAPTGQPAGTLWFDGTHLNAWPTKIANRTDSANEVPDPLGGNFPTIRLRLYAGDSNVTSNPRVQLETQHNISEGADFWYSFLLLLPDGFPTLSPGWFAVHEVYGAPYAGSPPWALGGSTLQSVFGWDGVWATPIAGLVGRWHRITVHELFSTNGHIQLWLDGTQQVDRFMATRDSTNGGAPNGIYAQLYRQAGPGWPDPTDIYEAGWKVGTTREIVEAP